MLCGLSLAQKTTSLLDPHFGDDKPFDAIVSNPPYSVKWHKYDTSYSLKLQHIFFDIYQTKLHFFCQIYEIFRQHSSSSDDGFFDIENVII